MACTRYSSNSIFFFEAIFSDFLLRGPLGLKGWALGACGLNGLKRARAHFKAAWAADSLNGLKRLNGAGELPRSMVREAPETPEAGKLATVS